MKVFWGVLAFLFLVSPVWAGMDMTPYKGSLELQRLKALAGY